jgi:elongation factor 1-alpha
MITGASQADVGLLVVATDSWRFETGSREGTTYEHSVLAFTLGIKQLIVAINKMDDLSTNWSQSRYEEIKEYVSIGLKKFGYDVDKIVFVPISALSGDNVLTRRFSLHWYTGPTLIEALDSLESLRSRSDLPLRLPIQDFFSVPGVGTVAVGRVTSGVLKPGMSVSLTPLGLTAEVTSIEKHSTPLSEASAGDLIGVCLKDIPVSKLRRGAMISATDDLPALETLKFVAQILVINLPWRIHAGYTPILHSHTANVPCRFNALLAKLDRRSGIVKRSLSF